MRMKTIRMMSTGMRINMHTQEFTVTAIHDDSDDNVDGDSSNIKNKKSMIMMVVMMMMTTLARIMPPKRKIVVLVTMIGLQ